MVRRYNSSTSEINRHSKNITQPKSQGAAQAMCKQFIYYSFHFILTKIINQNNIYIYIFFVVYATGLKPEDMNKAQVGIASV